MISDVLLSDEMFYYSLEIEMFVWSCLTGYKHFLLFENFNNGLDLDSSHELCLERLCSEFQTLKLYDKRGLEAKCLFSLILVI